MDEVAEVVAIFRAETDEFERGADRVEQRLDRLRRGTSGAAAPAPEANLSSLRHPPQPTPTVGARAAAGESLARARHAGSPTLDRTPEAPQWRQDWPWLDRADETPDDGWAATGDDPERVRLGALRNGGAGPLDQQLQEEVREDVHLTAQEHRRAVGQVVAAEDEKADTIRRTSNEATDVRRREEDGQQRVNRSLDLTAVGLGKIRLGWLGAAAAATTAISQTLGRSTLLNANLEVTGRLLGGVGDQLFLGLGGQGFMNEVNKDLIETMRLLRELREKGQGSLARGLVVAGGETFSGALDDAATSETPTDRAKAAGTGLYDLVRGVDSADPERALRGAGTFAGAVALGYDPTRASTPGQYPADMVAATQARMNAIGAPPDPRVLPAEPGSWEWEERERQLPGGASGPLMDTWVPHTAPAPWAMPEPVAPLPAPFTASPSAPAAGAPVEIVVRHVVEQTASPELRALLQRYFEQEALRGSGGGFMG